ncbi:MAG: hypothetical protein WDM81_20175 [Rhizomicrobium sp.]
MGLAAGAAQAQSQQALFDGYVGSPAYRAILLKAYNDAEPATLKAKCPALTPVAFDKPEIVEAPVFVKGPQGWRASTGAWVQRATLDACGTKVLRRELVETKSDNTLRTRGLLPGEFAGGYKLEETAHAYVVESMMNVTKCKDWKTPAVLDIVAAGKPTPKGWRENWTGLICGKTVTARVDYVPNGPQTDVVTSQIKAR